MNKEIETRHIFNANVGPLIPRIKKGDPIAEKLLFDYASPLIRRIVSKWMKRAQDTVDRREAVLDTSQDVCLHLLGALRESKNDIENPEAFIVTLTKNYLRNEYSKAMAEKRGAGLKREEVKDFEDKSRQETEEAEETEQENFKVSYMKLPADLRAGIERSLGLVLDLFQTRADLQKDMRRSRKNIKKINALRDARKDLEKEFRKSPTREDFHRLRQLERLTEFPLFDGTPETDAGADALLSEYRELREKVGPAYSLFEAEINLESEIYSTPATNPFAPFPRDASHPWGGFLPEIMEMRLRPETVIYKVWSRAAEFKIGKVSKYRSRKRIALAFQYHKTAFLETPREFLFRNIKTGSVEIVAKSVEQFRKAGYGQGLQKKYEPIIKLISRLSFPARKLCKKN